MAATQLFFSERSLNSKTEQKKLTAIFGLEKLLDLECKEKTLRKVILSLDANFGI